MIDFHVANTALSSSLLEVVLLCHKQKCLWVWVDETVKVSYVKLDELCIVLIMNGIKPPVNELKLISGLKYERIYLRYFY